MKKEKEKIDMVLLWVDGNDPKWLKEKKKYLEKGDSRKNRFRDYDTLQYLFRGIEKYASWVHQIFFVTWGHVPIWLDTKNPKIRVVKHEEFIPKEYLPTFNSNVIELNLHRIPDLSEHFILLNDDLFFLRKVEPEDFFQMGLPNDSYIEYCKKNCSNRYQQIRNNNFQILNFYFHKREMIKSNLGKYLHFQYGIYNFRNLLFLGKKQYYDLMNYHLAQSYLKSTYVKVWNQESDALTTSCYNRFRQDTDIGRGIFRYWQLLSGKFIPYHPLGKYFVLKNDNHLLMKVIKNRKYKLICINDSDPSIDFEKAKLEMKRAFEMVFPDKSLFEK